MAFVITKYVYLTVCLQKTYSSHVILSYIDFPNYIRLSASNIKYT